MKALTIHQPFAWAIGHDQPEAPRKNFEIRPDPTKYRGPVLIHAGKRPRPDVQPAVSAIMVALIETLARLIARVEVLERQVRGRRPHRRRRR